MELGKETVVKSENAEEMPQNVEQVLNEVEPDSELIGVAALDQMDIKPVSLPPQDLSTQFKVSAHHDLNTQSKSSNIDDLYNMYNVSKPRVFSAKPNVVDPQPEKSNSPNLLSSPTKGLNSPEIKPNFSDSLSSPAKGLGNSEIKLNLSASSSGPTKIDGKKKESLWATMPPVWITVSSIYVPEMVSNQIEVDEKGDDESLMDAETTGEQEKLESTHNDSSFSGTGEQFSAFDDQISSGGDLKFIDNRLILPSGLFDVVEPLPSKPIFMRKVKKEAVDCLGDSVLPQERQSKIEEDQLNLIVPKPFVPEYLYLNDGSAIDFDIESQDANTKALIDRMFEIEAELNSSLANGKKKTTGKSSSRSKKKSARSSSTANSGKSKSALKIVVIDGGDHGETIVDREKPLIKTSRKLLANKNLMDHRNEAYELLGALKELWKLENVEYRNSEGAVLCSHCFKIKKGGTSKVCSSCYGRTRRLTRNLSLDDYKQCVDCKKIRCIHANNRCGGCNQTYSKQRKESKKSGE